MEQIDILKFKEQTKKTIKKDFFLNRTKIPDYIIFGTELTAYIYSLINNSETNLFCSALLATHIQYFYSDYQKNLTNKTKEELNKLISETSEYKECKELYEKYIHSLAIFIKKLGFNNSLEICLFIKLLLENGALSYNQTSQYKAYTYRNNFENELTGAHLLSGNYLCLYASYFLKDILKELDYNAIVQIVKLEKRPIKTTSLLYPFVRFNHAVTGIVDKNCKFTYDLTNDLIGHKETKNCIKIAGNEGYFICCSKDEANINEDYAAFQSTESLEISSANIEDACFNVAETYINNTQELKNFYLSQIGNMYKIVELESKIFPQGDEPITKWVLTK